jgi:hypothetical protein
MDGTAFASLLRWFSLKLIPEPSPLDLLPRKPKNASKVSSFSPCLKIVVRVLVRNILVSV